MVKLNTVARLIAVLSVAFFISVDCLIADDKEVLTIGSKAPNVDVEHWISDNDGAFEHTTDLKSGEVYVIEFWATWCGPCISAMPHIAELQAEHGDAFQVISVSDEDMETVSKFLKRKARGEEEKTYADLTKTYCLTTDPDKSVKNDYFRAAGRTGIPCAFIVGKTGLVEWIGHPMRMDRPLEKVINDEWDREKFAVAYETERKRAAAERKKNNARRTAMNKVQKFLRDSEYQEAADYASKMMDDDEFKGSEDVLADLKLHAMVRGNLDGATESFEKYLKENSDNQRKTNRMLVTVLQANRKTAVAPEMFAVAKKSAAAIAEAEPKSAGSLYTYARFLYQEKDFDKAIEVQEKAVANGGPRKSVLERFLKVLKTEKEESEEGK